MSDSLAIHPQLRYEDPFKDSFTLAVSAAPRRLLHNKTSQTLVLSHGEALQDEERTRNPKDIKKWNAAMHMTNIGNVQR